MADHDDRSPRLHDLTMRAVEDAVFAVMRLRDLVAASGGPTGALEDAVRCLDRFADDMMRSRPQ